MTTTTQFLRRDPAEVQPWAETCGQIRCLIEEKDGAAGEVHPAEAAGPDAVDAHTRARFFRGQRGPRLVDALAARDDVDVPPVPREVEREVGQDLARRRVVREEEAVEEDQLQPRRTIQWPITSRSIFVRRKQSSACAGVHTTGSFSLNDVLSTIGTPVSRSNALMSR